jgi:hypothetical protein
MLSAIQCSAEDQTDFKELDISDIWVECDFNNTKIISVQK